MGKEPASLSILKTVKMWTVLSEIIQVFKQADWQAEIMLKEYGGHTMELAKQAAERGDDLIIAYGGDGTLNQVVNGIAEAKGKAKKHSVLGVIPGGTANVWATEFGIPKDPVQAALTLIESESRAVDLGCINVARLTLETASAGEQDARIYKNKSGKKSDLQSEALLLIDGRCRHRRGCHGPCLRCTKKSGWPSRGGRCRRQRAARAAALFC